MITMSPVVTLENMVSNNQEGIMLVNARMLHDFLGIKKDFSNWIKYMFSMALKIMWIILSLRQNWRKPLA